jgi:hypothetical protein
VFDVQRWWAYFDVRTEQIKLLVYFISSGSEVEVVKSASKKITIMGRSCL